MMADVSKAFGPQVLITHANPGAQTMAGRAVQALIANLRQRNVQVIEAFTLRDAITAVAVDAAIQCVILDWEMADNSHENEVTAALAEMRRHNPEVPVFLMARSDETARLPPEVLDQADDFIWLLENTPAFLGGRIMAAVQRYREDMMPPMFGALTRFSGEYEHSWHTPGHAGGAAFLKHPAGRAFFDFFGEQMFRSDLSISVADLGSLLDHSGPIGESEKYAAQVFGAHRSYHVTNGTSTANRIILLASVTRGDLVLCDRNCHKSIEHALSLAGAAPVWLMPSRNYLGMIGPIPPARLAPDAIERATGGRAAHHAIITNSTYDGLCYNIAHVEALLGGSIDRLQFDEAWFAYARFNSLYRDRFAMHGDPEQHDASRPTVFATHSTHKVLAALSQASFIHVRDGRNPIAHHRFNEAFMMQASTSPQYAIIASNDVSTAMMDGPYGETLTTEALQEAIAFRQTLARLHDSFTDKQGWFFSVWQPDNLADVPADELVRNPHHWMLHPGAAWHGFAALEADYCMLDPVKVSIITPGLGRDGAMAATGIPAAVLTAYLDRQGIIVEKTTSFTILFLFSIGITKGKWGTLVNALLDFKRDYDTNQPLGRVLPELVAAHPRRYKGKGLRDLATEMFEAMRRMHTTDLLAQAFSNLPAAPFTPQEAYEMLVRNEVEPVMLDRLANRTVATGVVPYPPGIPLLVPGENIGPEDGAALNYLRSLESFNASFPGFGHDTHGIENIDGRHQVYCLKQRKT